MTAAAWTTWDSPQGDPLAGAGDQDRAFYLANYGTLPLAEIFRRLRLAEWNAEYRKRELNAALERAKAQPAAWLVAQVDARQKRLKTLLDHPGRISRNDLYGALTWGDLRWDAHLAETGRGAAA